MIDAAWLFSGGISYRKWSALAIPELMLKISLFVYS